MMIAQLGRKNLYQLTRLTRLSILDENALIDAKDEAFFCVMPYVDWPDIGRDEGLSRLGLKS
jgi:hypothetical protein